MWFVLGGLAIIFTLMNLILFAFGKDYKWSMALGVSFTALTLCAELSQVNTWVQAEDWGALEDVVPTMNFVLWGLTVLSVLINITPIVIERRRKAI